MIVGEVASLAHAHGVEHPVGVRTARGILASAVLTVAAGAHVLGIMFPVGVRAFCDKHDLL